MGWNLKAKLNRCRLEETLKENNQLLGTLKAGPIYPHALREQEFVDWVVRNDNKRITWYKKEPAPLYDTWMTLLREDEFEDGDTYEIGVLRTNLYKYWDDHLRAIQKANAHETEIRKGIENMIKLAFETRLGGKQIYRAKRDLFLPRDPYITTASTATWMLLPADWYKFLARELRDALYVFASETNHARYVITFVCEYKVSDASVASRQLTFDMCSAQNQRRALGFDDGQLFGATLIGNILTMYVSEWEGDGVVIYPTTTSFELDTFIAFLNCYIFFCRLADRIAEDVQKVFTKWETAEGRLYLQQKNRNAARNPWRLSEKPQSAPSNKRTRTDEGSKGSSGQEAVSFPHWQQFDEQFEGPLMPGGNPLVEANLRVLNESTTASVITTAEDIASWVRQSARSCPDVA